MDWRLDVILDRKRAAKKLFVACFSWQLFHRYSADLLRPGEIHHDGTHGHSLGKATLHDALSMFNGLLGDIESTPD